MSMSEQERTTHVGWVGLARLEGAASVWCGSLRRAQFPVPEPRARSMILDFTGAQPDMSPDQTLSFCASEQATLNNYSSFRL